MLACEIRIPGRGRHASKTHPHVEPAGGGACAARLGSSALGLGKLTVAIRRSVSRCRRRSSSPRSQGRTRFALRQDRRSVALPPEQPAYQRRPVARTRHRGARPNGDAVPAQSSRQRSVNEPYLDLMVEVNWASGRVVRDYTFLLDPPGHATPPPVEPVAPVRTGAAPGRAAPRRRSAPRRAAAAAAGAARAGAQRRRRRHGRSLHGQARRHAVQDRQRLQAGGRDARADAGRAVQQQPARVRRHQHEPAARRRDPHIPSAGPPRRPPGRGAKIVRVQATDWRGYRDRVAGAAPAAKARAPAPPAARSAPRSRRSPPAAARVATSSRFARSRTRQGPAALPRPKTRVARRGAQGSASRIAELEKTLKDLQSAVELKDSMARADGAGGQAQSRRRRRRRRLHAAERRRAGDPAPELPPQPGSGSRAGRRRRARQGRAAEGARRPRSAESPQGSSRSSSRRSGAPDAPPDAGARAAAEGGAKAPREGSAVVLRRSVRRARRTGCIGGGALAIARRACGADRRAPAQDDQVRGQHHLAAPTSRRNTVFGSTGGGVVNTGDNSLATRLQPRGPRQHRHGRSRPDRRSRGVPRLRPRRAGRGDPQGRAEEGSAAAGDLPQAARDPRPAQQALGVRDGRRRALFGFERPGRDLAEGGRARPPARSQQPDVRRRRRAAPPRRPRASAAAGAAAMHSATATTAAPQPESRDGRGDHDHAADRGRQPKGRRRSISGSTRTFPISRRRASTPGRARSTRPHARERELARPIGESPATTEPTERRAEPEAAIERWSGATPRRQPPRRSRLHLDDAEKPAPMGSCRTPRPSDGAKPAGSPALARPAGGDRPRQARPLVRPGARDVRGSDAVGARRPVARRCDQARPRQGLSGNGRRRGRPRDPAGSAARGRRQPEGRSAVRCSRSSAERGFRATSSGGGATPPPVSFRCFRGARVVTPAAMRIALGLEYSGTAFTGWQSQPDGRGVQDALERALAAIAAAPVRRDCGGPHRSPACTRRCRSCISTSTATRPHTAWVRGVNAHLPADVAVLWAHPVPAAFHARFAAMRRHYTYLLCARGGAPGARLPGASAGTIGLSTSQAMHGPPACSSARTISRRSAPQSARPSRPCKHMTHASVTPLRGHGALRLQRRCVPSPHDPQHRRHARVRSAPARAMPRGSRTCCAQPRPHARGADVRAGRPLLHGRRLRRAVRAALVPARRSVPFAAARHRGG